MNQTCWELYNHGPFSSRKTIFINEKNKTKLGMQFISGYLPVSSAEFKKDLNMCFLLKHKSGECQKKSMLEYDL